MLFNWFSFLLRQQKYDLWHGYEKDWKKNVALKMHKQAALLITHLYRSQK